MSTQSKTFGSFVSSVNGANRIGVSKAKVGGAASTAFQEDVGKRDDYSRTIQEGFRIGQMSLNEATGLKQVESMGKLVQRLTLFDDTDAFTAVMPKKETPLLRTQMDIVTYLPTITKPNPERTRAHTVQQRRSRIFATLERVSVAQEVTYASLDDSEGLASYEMGVMQMVSAAIEGDALRMLAELQTCHTPFRNPLTRYGYKAALSVQQLKEAFNLEASFFAIMQREGNALTKLEAMIEPIQKRTRGKGNTYAFTASSIFSSSVLSLLSSRGLSEGLGTLWPSLSAPPSGQRRMA